MRLQLEGKKERLGLVNYLRREANDSLGWKKQVKHV